MRYKHYALLCQYFRTTNMHSIKTMAYRVQTLWVYFTLIHKRCVLNFYFIVLWHDPYSSPNIVRVTKSRRIRWLGHVARMGEKRSVCRDTVGKPEWKRPLGRPRRRWEDSIKIDLQEVGCGGIDWIDLAQDKDRWRALVNTVMNLRVP